MPPLTESKRPLTKPQSAELEPGEAMGFDHELDVSAQQFLDSEPQLANLEARLDGNTPLWIKSAANIVQKATRKQHLKSIRFAYAIWIRAKKNPGHQEYISSLRKQCLKKNKQTTDLHLVVRDLVFYGDEGGNAPGADYRRLHNRDASAISYLHHNRIGPAELEDYASRSGEGLDTWSRAWSTIRKSNKSDGERADIDSNHNIAISLRSIDDIGRAIREHFTVADEEEVRLLIEKLRAYKIERKKAAPDNKARPLQGDQAGPRPRPRTGPTLVPRPRPRPPSRIGPPPVPRARPVNR